MENDWMSYVRRKISDEKQSDVIWPQEMLGRKSSGVIWSQENTWSKIIRCHMAGGKCGKRNPDSLNRKLKNLKIESPIKLQKAKKTGGYHAAFI